MRVVGLGPGDPSWLLPEAAEALDWATDLVGYGPYLDMVPSRLASGAVRHGSDNRVEIQRARHALEMAAAGRRVAVISSGDPGVFAMASAVLEAQFDTEALPAWTQVRVRIVPGVSAAFAAASRVGAPLGHDFCVISLSDNLKPWSVIERRVRAALEADLVLALYNPVSRHRPHQLGVALDLVRSLRPPSTPVVMARDVGRPGEAVTVTSVGEMDAGICDMRTVILVGSTTTRVHEGAAGPVVITPRSYP